MSAVDCRSTARIWGEYVLGLPLELLWGVRVSGLERVPREGPVIVACNHVSLIDPILLGWAVRGARRPGFLGKRELFDLPLVGDFLFAAGCIPLDRSKGDLAALRTAAGLLKRGGCVAIFPEGTRVPLGQTRAPRAGVSLLARLGGAPVVPVRVAGTGEDFPRAYPLEVRFGEPLAPPAEGGREAGEEYALSVMRAVYAL